MKTKKLLSKRRKRSRKLRHIIKKQVGGLSSIFFNSNNRLQKTYKKDKTDERLKRLMFFNEMPETEANEIIETYKYEKDSISKSKPDTIIGNYTGDFTELTANDFYEDSVLDASVIDMVASHGHHHDNMEKVPSNTIICFISSINNFSQSRIQDLNDNIYRFINTIDEECFKALFQYRSEYGKNNEATADTGTLDSGDLGKRKIQHTLFHCFRNSVWYYPRDIYPDLNLCLSKTEFNKNIGSDNFKSVEVSQKGNIITDITEQIFVDISTIGNETIKLRISETLTKLDPVVGGFRLFITLGCRSLYGLERDKIRQFLSFELMQFHKNNLNDRKIIKTRGSNIKNDCHWENMFCGTINNVNYFINQTLHPNEKDRKNMTVQFLEYIQSSKYHSYGGKVSSLMRIQEKINIAKDIIEADCIYISTFSIPKILLFFSNDRNEVHFEKFLRIVIKNTNFIRRLSLMAHFYIKLLTEINIINMVPLNKNFLLILEFMESLNRYRSTLYREDSILYNSINMTFIHIKKNALFKKLVKKLRMSSNYLLYQDKFYKTGHVEIGEDGETIKKLNKHSKVVKAEVLSISIKYRDFKKLKYLSRYSNLKELTFKLNLGDNNIILNKLPSVNCVTLEGDLLHRTNRKVSILNSLPNLSILSFTNCNVLNIHGSYPTLSTLHISDCSLDPGFKFSILPITKLSLISCPITNDILNDILTMKQLEILELENVNVGEGEGEEVTIGEEINVFSSIKELTLKNCTGIEIMLSDFCKNIGKTIQYINLENTNLDSSEVRKLIKGRRMGNVLSNRNVYSVT